MCIPRRSPMSPDGWMRPTTLAWSSIVACSSCLDRAEQLKRPRSKSWLMRWTLTFSSTATAATSPSPVMMVSLDVEIIAGAELTTSRRRRSRFDGPAIHLLPLSRRYGTRSRPRPRPSTPTTCLVFQLVLLGASTNLLPLETTHPPRRPAQYFPLPHQTGSSISSTAIPRLAEGDLSSRGHRLRSARSAGSWTGSREHVGRGKARGQCGCEERVWC